MPYSKTTFVDLATPDIVAAEMNKIGQGIELASSLFNVKDPVYAGGAKLDGTTDDTAAVQAALDAAGAATTFTGNGGGATVLIPFSANPCIFTNLKIPAYVTLRGQSMSYTYLKRKAGATGPAIREKTAGEGNSAGASGIWIRDLRVDGNATAGDGIDLGNQGGPSLNFLAGLDNVFVGNFPSGIGFKLHTNAVQIGYIWANSNQVGVHTLGGGASTYTGVWAEANTLYDVRVADPYNSFEYIHTEWYNGGVSVLVEGSDNLFERIIGTVQADGTDMVQNASGATRNRYQSILAIGTHNAVNTLHFLNANGYASGNVIISNVTDVGAYPDRYFSTTTGAVSVLGSSASQFWYNVKDYGAVGDGIADDTIPIQNAITAAHNTGLGGTVFFPAGGYKITSSLTVPGNNMVTFQGAGSSGYSALLGYGVSRILVPVGVTGVVYGPAASTYYVGAPLIRDIHFQGPGATANSSTIGLAIQNIAGGLVRACTFSDFYTAGTGCKVQGTGGREVAYQRFINCRFVKNFIGLDFVDPVHLSTLFVDGCLFDAENNSLPAPAAGSIGVRNALQVSNCVMQSYETLIDCAEAGNGYLYAFNRFENFFSGVNFHPASDTDMHAQVFLGSSYSSVASAAPVRMNTHAGGITVYGRPYQSVADLNATAFPNTISGTGAAVSAERALSMGLGGTVPATAADTADFVVQVPFNMTLKRLKVTAKTGPGGAMAVQLRRSTNPTTPSYSNVTGFVATFTAGQSSAVVDPADVDVNEGDLLNFSVSTGGGQNLLVEAIGVTR